MWKPRTSVRGAGLQARGPCFLQAAGKRLSSDMYQKIAFREDEELDSFVSGHDFSRTVNDKLIRALQAAEKRAEATSEAQEDV